MGFPKSACILLGYCCPIIHHKKKPNGIEFETTDILKSKHTKQNRTNSPNQIMGTTARVEDDYFQKDEDVLAVYDYDYAAVIDFTYKLTQRQALCIACIPHCWPCSPCLVGYTFSEQFFSNVVDLAEAQHVSLTRDGIKYIVETHKTGCRMDCQDVGKVSKTVPYDKITGTCYISQDRYISFLFEARPVLTDISSDCDVQEPAGSSGPFCCMVQNVLSSVNVDTASGNRSGGSPNSAHELVLSGLKDPHQFKKDVWSMKRGDGIHSSPYVTSRGGAGVISAPSTFEMERLGGGVIASGYSNQTPLTTSGGGGNGNLGMSVKGETEMLALMREQNELLKKQNRLLKDVLEK